MTAMEQFQFCVAEEEGLMGFFILNLYGAKLNAIYIHLKTAATGAGKHLFRFAERLSIDISVAEMKRKSTMNAVGFYES